MSQLAENLEKVQIRIRNACEACGRNAEDVALLAVSKKKDVEAIRAVMQRDKCFLAKTGYRKC
jgi:PLP dependent protein